MLNWYNNSPNTWVTLSIVIPLAIGAIIHHALRKLDGMKEPFELSAPFTADYIMQKLKMNLEQATKFISHRVKTGVVVIWAEEAENHGIFKEIDGSILVDHILIMKISEKEKMGYRVLGEEYREEGWIQKLGGGFPRTVWIGPRFQRSVIEREVKSYLKSIPRMGKVERR